MPDPNVQHADRLPPRTLPLLYFGFAHLCLAAAFLALALWPDRFVGFFYHPRMVGVVHLVTLGWISASILGAVYLIAPIALRTRIPAGWPDGVAFVLFSVGTLGMTAHFWIDAYGGMVWAAVTVLLGVLWVGGRVAVALWPARIPGAVKLHMILAFLNLLVAGTVGGLVGVEKLQVHVLPGYLLHTVYGHAHVAALGWATMMVMGTGYRLFPMVLPATMPKGPRLYASALVLEAGLLGLMVGLPARSRLLTGLSAVLCAAGVGFFLYHVDWMRRRPKPPPRNMPRPDLGALQAMTALLWLLGAVAIGLALALAPPGAWKVRVAGVYGVAGLVGFLSQIVVGMSARLVPMFSWMHAYVGSEFEHAPPAPYEMADRRVQAATYGAWAAGVPLLAAAVWLEDVATLRAAAVLLLAGVGLAAFNFVRTARVAYAAPRPEADR